MLFPFVRDWFAKRAPGGGQNLYKKISIHTDSNLTHAYESLIGPPNQDIRGTHGYLVAQSPGPVGAPFIPFFEIVQNPNLALGQTFETQGILTENYIGGGQLYTSPDSAPEQEIF